MSCLDGRQAVPYSSRLPTPQSIGWPAKTKVRPIAISVMTSVRINLHSFRVKWGSVDNNKISFTNTARVEMFTFRKTHAAKWERSS